MGGVTMQVPLDSWGWAWAALRGALLDALSGRRREHLVKQLVPGTNYGLVKQLVPGTNYKMQIT